VQEMVIRLTNAKEEELVGYMRNARKDSEQKELRAGWEEGGREK